MPKEKPEWEIMHDAEKMIAQLVQRYPDKLPQIDPTTIGVAAIVNKEPPESQDWVSKIEGIKAPAALYCSKQYIIHFYKSKWDAMDEAQRAWMLLAKLCRIDDEKDGGVLQEDLKDVKRIVKAVGVDYLYSTSLPNPLVDTVSF